MNLLRLSSRHARRLLVACVPLVAFACADEPPPPTSDGTIVAPLDELPAVRLRHRSFTPEVVFDDALMGAAKAAQRDGQPLRAIAVFADRPGASDDWSGITLEGFIHDGAWLVRLDLDADQDLASQLEDRLQQSGAGAFAMLEPSDKASDELLTGELPEWAVDSDTGLVKVVAQRFKSASVEDLEAVATTFHEGAEPAAIDAYTIALEVPLARLPELLAVSAIETVDAGPAPGVEAMEAVRSALNVSPPDRPDTCLTGEGVHIGTYAETPWKHHLDFQAYDANGIATGNRILSGGGNAGMDHATHVVGIMLGNGWRSASEGGLPFQWRGVAPDANLVGRGDPSPLRRTHLANASMVSQSGADRYQPASASRDREARGEDGIALFFTQFWASGNNGLGPVYGATRGNYSIFEQAKNVIAIGNVFAEDLTWAASGMGPTMDGRIKPDLVAPGCRIRFPHSGRIDFDLEQVTIHRGNFPDIAWRFDTAGDLEGWEAQNTIRIDMGPPSQIASPYGRAVRHTLFPYKPRVEVDEVGPLGNRVALATKFIGAVGQATDQVRLRYRYADTPIWNGGSINVFWDYGTGNGHAYATMSLPVQTDGAWHDAVVPVGTDARWQGKIIRQLRFDVHAYNPGSVVATGYPEVYEGKCGTSMATPAATGIGALVMQHFATHFGVNLDDPTAPSPFDLAAQGVGRPRTSTMKALLVHTAKDLARFAHPSDPNAPDTNAPVEYHKGPDYMSGYGIVDGEEALRFLDEVQAGHAQIIERDAVPGQHDYTITIPANDKTPLRVTLAWDDPAASPVSVAHAPKLVNNLDLLLITPSGTKRFPWSLELPYDPTNCGGCLPPEDASDEPITAADFHPARKDVPNDRDNVEVVDVETPEAGTWTVRVKMPSLPLGAQKYSLVIGRAPKAPDALVGGKVVFVSDRVNPPQLFLKVNDGTQSPPTQLTPALFAARDPVWSPDGRYVAYLVKNTVFGTDALGIWDTAGQNHQSWLEPFTGYKQLSRPSWSPDGSELFVAYGSSPTTRGIGAITRATGQTRTLVVPGATSWSPDAPVFAGADPSGVVHLVMSATTPGQPSALFRVPVAGGALERMWADGVPSTRALYPSVSPDGERILFTSDDWQVDPLRFKHREMIEMGTLGATTTKWTDTTGDQIGRYAIGGTGEWIMESNVAPGGKRFVMVQQHGQMAALYLADPTNTYDDHSPSWWVRNPNVPLPDPDAPALACPAPVVHAPEVGPCAPRPPPTLTATSMCANVGVNVVASPAMLSGNGPHTVTYTATDRLGHVTTCQTTITYSCGSWQN